MREILREFIVISAARVDQSVDRNTVDTKALRDLLKDLPNPFRECTGVYKGVAEISFAVFLSEEFSAREQELGSFIRLGAAFRQESILWVTNERSAYLIDCQHDDQTYIGDWRESIDPASVAGKDHTEYRDQSGQSHYAWVT